MTVALVHGNPETAAVWDPLVVRLRELGHDEPVRLSPPGFGFPVPDTFTATVDGYRNWLIRELEAIGHPVDLVGHDWGGAHVLTLLMARPDLVRSWVSDCIGVLHPAYVWHQLAQIWQDPGEGERWIERQLALTLEQRASFLVERGMPDPPATAVAAGFDAAMGECILALYRSALQPAMARRGHELARAAARPGLVIIAAADTAVGTIPQRREAAATADAQVAELNGLGHWWMAQDGGRAGAEALHRFWAGIT